MSKISITASGETAKVVVDGKDISNDAIGYKLEQSAGGPAQLTVTFSRKVDQFEVDGDAEVSA